MLTNVLYAVGIGLAACAAVMAFPVLLLGIAGVDLSAPGLASGA